METVECLRNVEGPAIGAGEGSGIDNMLRTSEADAAMVVEIEVLFERKWVTQCNTKSMVKKTNNDTPAYKSPK